MVSAELEKISVFVLLLMSKLGIKKIEREKVGLKKNSNYF